MKATIAGSVVALALGGTGVAIATGKTPPLPTEITVKDQKTAKKIDAKLLEINEEADEFNASLAEKYQLVDGCDTIDWQTRKINRKSPCKAKTPTK